MSQNTGPVRPSASTSPDGGLDLDQTERYEDLGVLGRGGMGEVHAVQDQRLGREVALKVPHDSDGHAAARLEREASLAARLEHPGIVPVYDAGRLPDGRVYYTMRVIRGESLQQALSLTLDLADRLRLIRPLLDACEAVAYAHDQGVLHRDLKPANVMIGEHGGTVVVDWGLAVLLDGVSLPPPPPRSPDWMAEPTWGGELERELDLSPGDTAAAGPESTRPLFRSPSVGGARTANWELTLPGQVFGTPAYMPPEQARGETLGRPADVFALGGCLFFLLTGRSPRTSMDPNEAIPSVESLCPDAPAELTAIVARAMAADPERRYPDAGALAADLGAWFEGRRVAAYSYSAWELTRRFVATWRVPLIVAAVALVALSAAVGLGWWRTLIEKDKALQAENIALDASARSDRYLAGALVAQAQVATDAGVRARAELLSAHRLRFGESPDARGILARFAGQPRPRRVATESIQDCPRPMPDSRGGRVVCLLSDAAVVYALSPLRALQRVPGAYSYATFAGVDEQHLLLIEGANSIKLFDLKSGLARSLAAPPNLVNPSDLLSDGSLMVRHGPVVDLLDVKAGELVALPHCEASKNNEYAFVGASGTIYRVCAGGPSGASTFEISRPGAATVPMLDVPRGDGVVTGFTVQESPVNRLFLGTERGLVYVLNTDDGSWSRVETKLQTISQIQVAGDRVAFSALRGGTVVMDVSTLGIVARLPTHGATPRWIEDGVSVRSFGPAIEDWSLPAVVMPLKYDVDVGVSAVAISGDAARLAWALGSGQIQVVDRATGAVLLDKQISTGVAKDVTFSPDGSKLAAGGSVGDGAQVFDLQSGAQIGRVSSRATRRLAWTAGGLYSAPYAFDMLRWAGGDEALAIWASSLGTSVGDLDVLADDDGLVFAADPDTIYRYSPGSTSPTRITDVERLAAVAGTRRYSYAVAGLDLIRLDGAGVVTARVEAPRESCGALLEVAAAPQDRWIAVGCLSGAILVYQGSDFTHIATLPGHTGRVGSLAFDAGGRWLLSGGWEGTVRVWDLAVLTLDADALVGPLERDWGMGLEEALGAVDIKR